MADPQDAQQADSSIAQAASVLEEAARREKYRLERLAAVQAELKKFQDSFKKENGGGGSGRLKAPVQARKDKLTSAIKRLQDGYLPGEAQPPQPRGSADLLADVRQHAQYHAPAQPPPGGRPIGRASTSGASTSGSASGVRPASHGTTSAPDRDTGDVSAELEKAHYYKVRGRDGADEQCRGAHRWREPRAPGSGARPAPVAHYGQQVWQVGARGGVWPRSDGSKGLLRAAAEAAHARPAAGTRHRGTRAARPLRGHARAAWAAAKPGAR